MTNAETQDGPLIEFTDPSLRRPLPAPLHGARADIIAMARDLAAIPEAALTQPWSWIGGSEEEVRYGAYRAAEALEQAETEARHAAAHADLASGDAMRIIGPATAARWDLLGLLMPLEEARLDADPGGDEWSLRLVVGHVISGQRAYAWGTAWWQAQGYELADPNLPAGAPEAMWDDLPDEATTEAEGTIDDLRARLDATLDLSAERLAGLPDERFGFGSRWSGFPVTIGFRIGRWSSHIREHTIQVEKTLAMLHREPSEPERLVRHVLAAYGRAEAVVFGGLGGDEAVERVVHGAADARAAVRSAREAAGV